MQLRQSLCSNDTYHQPLVSVCSQHCKISITQSVCFMANHGGNLWAVLSAGISRCNGAGPGVWAVVGTPVLKMMKDEGF
jgi:hypothetical protein